eukprot:Amastigsp_a678738_33.p1 type:complete len:326 gc:universal Amastigsp_a678738_33:48-1025(+)
MAAAPEAPTDSPWREVAVAASPSPIANNLSSNGLHFVYADGVDVHMVPVSYSEARKSRARNTKITESSKTLVTQVKWCWLKRSAVIAVTSNDTIRVIDATGTRTLFTYSMTTDNVSAFYRGVTASTLDDVSSLLVGTSVGDILVLSERGELSGTLTGNGCSITELTSFADTRDFEHDKRAGLMISGDESGVVSAWDLRSQAKTTALFGGEGIPCTCVRLMDGAAIATFANGVIRVLSLESGTVTAEIAAHSRFISSLALSRDRLAVTAGYDGLVYSWDLSDLQNIKRVFAGEIPSSLLQGVATSTDADFAVVAYDSHRVRFFKPR